MDKIEVLYLSYDGMTDSLGKSQVLPYLVGLSAKGFQFTLISFEKKNQLAKYKTQIENITKSSKIKWIPLLYTPNPPILSTLWDMFCLKQTLKRLLKENKYKIVHCRSYLTAMTGIWLKKKYKIRFLFDMRGFWVNERVEGGIWKVNNPIYKTIYNYFKRKELTLFKEADYIISLTELAKKEILSWQKLNEIDLKIEVIPCCADLKLFSKTTIDQNILKEIKKNIKIPDNRFILTYFGSIGTWYLIKEMLEFFKTLLSRKKDCHFLIVTHDDNKKVWDMVQQLNINKDNISVVSADRSEMPYYISLSNYSIFFIKQVFSKKASSPTKLAEILGLGVPVICNSGIGDVDTIIKNTKSGFIINSFTEIEYQQVIDKILNQQQIDNKEEIIAIAEKYFSLDKGVEKYNAIYNHLLT